MSTFDSFKRLPDQLQKTRGTMGQFLKIFFGGFLVGSIWLAGFLWMMTSVYAGNGPTRRIDRQLSAQGEAVASSWAHERSFWIVSMIGGAVFGVGAALYFHFKPEEWE